MKYNYKLQSNIPGVTVTLTRNPLNARIELTESAKREFALLVWTKFLIENYFLTTGFYIDPRGGKIIDGVYVPDEPNIAEAKFWQKRGEEIYWGKDLNQEFTTERCLQDDLVKSFLEELNSPHMGDCTAFAASCERCYAEEILGLNTLPVGKSIGYKMRGLYEHYFGTAEEKERTAQANEEWQKKYGHKIFWTPTFDEKDADARDFFDEHQKLVGLYI